MAHIEGDLLNLHAVRTHHVQGEGIGVTAFFQRGELGFSLIQQPGPCLALAG